MFASTKISYHTFLKTLDYEAYCSKNDICPLDLPSYFMCIPHNMRTIDSVAAPNAFVHPLITAYTLRACVSAMKKYNCIRTFIRFANRRMKKSMCTNDFSLSPLSAFKKNALYDVFDRGSKYTFRVSDLISIILCSITHSHEFICDPIPVKNPYTGQPFKKSALYRFFIHLNLSAFAVPVLFSLFAETDFDINLFLLKHEPLLRDVVIRAVVDNFTKLQKVSEVRNMLYNMTTYDIMLGAHVPILDANRISPSLIIALFPLLHHYFIYLYSLNPYRRQIENVFVIKTLFKHKRA